ncbi:peptide MFS transporter [Gallaecimonas xiamenensis]|uniref:Amino acid/peptide transporter n=1 Tax=Gallaecimonas xiamenensis 3-C-1 TaxID=745411 RepID=K2J3A6_9GAMM|nr:oligopeptide:H+ symporter [Gallaecimonas xiamenensis]EKE77501.1 amino acid/peptide transporter [Gallaecimonas xiamenensis 3-C-1]
MSTSASLDAVKAEESQSRRAFVALFMIEMWERFGFYGMQILMVLFAIEYLGFNDDRANLTWGAFAAMIYITPVAGGWIGDKVLGARRTTMLGGVVLALGYGLLAVPWDQFMGESGHSLVFFSMGVIAVGNGLFKANPNNLVAKLYEGDESKLDGAFTLYYMSINIGAFLSQCMTPIIRVHYGWHWAFLICALGLVFGVAQFKVQSRYLAHVGSAPDFKPMDKRKLLGVLGGSLVVAVLIGLVVQSTQVAEWVVNLASVGLALFFLVLVVRATSAERAGLIAMVILTLQTILFFIFYQQMSTSLTLFAKNNVELQFLGYSIPPEQFQVLNPFWIAVMSPVLAWLYASLGKKDKDPSLAGKYAWGFVLLAIGFFLYAVSGNFANALGLVSPQWMLWGYMFQSVGELLISGLGLGMVARYVAPGLRGLMMGAWLLATGLSQYLGSVVANFASVPENITSPLQTLPLYTGLFMKLGWVALAGALVAIVLVPYLKRLDRRSKEAAALWAKQ